MTELDINAFEEAVTKLGFYFDVLKNKYQGLEHRTFYIQVNRESVFIQPIKAMEGLMTTFNEILADEKERSRKREELENEVAKRLYFEGSTLSDFDALPEKIKESYRESARKMIKLIKYGH